MKTALGMVLVLIGAAAPGDVEVQLFRFRPARLAVPRGAQVQWANRDDVRHTVTAGTPEAPTDAFRVVLDGRGATGRVRFETPGTYAYFCERHHHMRGEIDVQSPPERSER